MSEYPEFINRFSVVDVVSYFAPGALYSLYTHYLAVKSGNNAFLEAVDAVFSGSVLARAVYFCIVSYIAGMMLSEVSYWIWTCVGAGFRKIMKKGTDNDLNEQTELIKDMIPAERLRKAQLFQCFYGLFRSLSVVIPTLFVEIGLFCSVSTRNAYFPMFIVAEIICIMRALRFLRKYQVYRIK